MADEVNHTPLLNITGQLQHPTIHKGVAITTGFTWPAGSNHYPKLGQPPIARSLPATIPLAPG